jgi:hypothetical protein
MGCGKTRGETNPAKDDPGKDRFRSKARYSGGLLTSPYLVRGPMLDCSAMPGGVFSKPFTKPAKHEDGILVLFLFM